MESSSQEFLWRGERRTENTAGHIRLLQGKVGGESKYGRVGWREDRRVGREERAYKVRFQVGVLIKGL